MELLSLLKETETKELKRAYNSNKSYVEINVSVFNVGACIYFKLTDKYKPINANTWNGYDVVVDNDWYFNRFVEQELIERGVLKMK